MSETMPILAYDCAVAGASVTVRTGEGRIRAQIANNRQAAELVPLINALLARAGIGYRDLGGIVTTIGPGSFTGVRIGLATLHGMVAVCATPVRLLTTLEAFAWQVAMQLAPPMEFNVYLNAGKGEVYSQPFSLQGDAPKASGGVTLIPEAARNSASALPAYGHVADPLAPTYIAVPDTDCMASIALRLAPATLAEAIPCYVRAPDAIAPAPLAWLG
jgi:tRNA threonylcarbamoyladenosine biosynthesis protein TsaB